MFQGNDIACKRAMIHIQTHLKEFNLLYNKSYTIDYKLLKTSVQYNYSGN